MYCTVRQLSATSTVHYKTTLQQKIPCGCQPWAQNIGASHCTQILISERKYTMMLEGETAPIVDTNWLNQNAAWVKSKRQYVLSIFQFPTDRLGLVVANEAEERERSAAEIHLKAEDLEIRNALRCRICGMTFEDLGTMRSHFKSEAHIANINGAGTSASIHKGSADAAMSSGGLDALGGEKDSDSESSADEGAEVGGFIIPANSDFTAFDQGLVKRVYSAQEGARTVFRRASWNKLEFSVSNAVLGSTDEHLTNETDPLTNPWPTIMRAMCTYSINSVWFVASLRSGRFAAALFDGNQVLCHKAFRRLLIFILDLNRPKHSAFFKNVSDIQLGPKPEELSQLMIIRARGLSQ